MIQNIEKCSEIEIEHQAKYLLDTPVSGIVQYLKNGELKLSKGKVDSLHLVGNLKTEFGEIGSIVPSAKKGEIKFVVSELVPALRNNPNVNDGGLLEAIEAIAEKEKKNEIEFNVTVLMLRGEPIVKDGNKRTVAFYENRKSNLDQKICYPVYVVHE